MNALITYLFLFSISICMGQVGIGTVNPQADLHVAGDALIQTELSFSNLTTVTPLDEDFKLISRVTSSLPVGELKVLDVDALNVAPVNSVDLHFTNISSDNLTDVDLQYDTSQYIVSVANFRYVGDAIKKVPLGSTNSIGNFVVKVFESGGTWHLEIRNRILDLDPGDSLEYHVTLIIYNKSYFRNLTPITTDLGGLNNGTASSIPNLY